MSALTDLRAKVAAGATGRWTFDALGDAEEDALDAFHGSLDAAKALHEAVLPGWEATIDTRGNAGVILWSKEQSYRAFCDGNPARAWLLAILDALIAKEASDE